MSICIVGSTGLCGNAILKHAPDYYDHIYTFSRLQPDNSSSSKVQTFLEHDATLWVDKIKQLDAPDKEVFFSGLGTTRTKAGGLESQYKIDHDLNLALAKAAKESGFKQYVLISSTGASSHSVLPYLKMKGELEDHVLKLGFERTIILRPGILLGERKERRNLSNSILATVGSWTHDSFIAKYTMSPITGEEVAEAALKLSKTPITKKVLIVSELEVNKASKK